MPDKAEMAEWLWVLLIAAPLTYGVGTLLIRAYFRRKEEFVDRLQDKIGKGL